MSFLNFIRIILKGLSRNAKSSRENKDVAAKMIMQPAPKLPSRLFAKTEYKKQQLILNCPNKQKAR